MLETTRNQVNIWRRDNPRGFREQVDCTNPRTTTFGQVERTGECFSRYRSYDLREQIEPPSCRQYKPGDFLAVRPQNWNEIIAEDDDNENWADPGRLSGGRSWLGNGNDTDDGEGEEHTQRGENGTGKWKGTQDGKWKG
jgi:hypothetical protein